MNDVTPLLQTELSAASLEAMTTSFVFLHDAAVTCDDAALDALVTYLRTHPDYAACAPRLVNSRGEVVTTWSDARGSGVAARVDARLRHLASAPLASRDPSVLSCAALVVDREELLAYLEHLSPPWCAALARHWTRDARRLRLCADVEATWATNATSAPDLDAG